MATVTMVRVYFTEGRKHMEPIIQYLHEIAKVKGVTVFRGIYGFGQSGSLHSSSLVDLSLDLPLVIEFFDEPKRVDGILKELNQKIDPGHIVIWSAEMNP